MRGQNGTNPAAGKRWLFPKSHARVLDEQTEGLARIVRGDERLIAAAQMIVDCHRELRLAEAHIRAANERASSAAYEAPASTVACAA